MRLSSIGLPVALALLLVAVRVCRAHTSPRQDARLAAQVSRRISSSTNSTSQGQRPTPGDDRTLRTRRAAGAECARQPAIFGLRCDEGAEVDEGVLVLRANQPTELLLLGRDLDAGLSVALTPTFGEAQDDCTHMDRVKSLTARNVSSQVALVTVDLPAPISDTPFYLCVRAASDVWRHQGAAPWLQLRVHQDFLPLVGKLVVIAALLALSGLFSGLNLGLMALDKNELQVIISCGSDSEKRHARAIEPVRRRGNYLLCSILFSNVLVNSTIAVLLEELTSGVVAVMTSTIFIVMFGEILPQAFCSRHGLAVGAKTVSLTYFCMIVTFPLSWPVSSALDWVLGEEIGHAYDRERLMEFIRVTRDYNNLETDEVNIISGALRLRRIQLAEVMTRIEDVFMLDVGAALDFATIQAIVERGYSRVPVHESGNRKSIVALLFAKDLALLDPDDRTPVQTLISFYQHPLVYLFEDSTLDAALNEFKTGKAHLAFVRRVIDDGDRDPVYEVTGIVTLEDVIEEIMQMEINDETDTLSDNRRKRRRKEAQVRNDFGHFARLGEGDPAHQFVSPQLRLAAYQFLACAVGPFARDLLSDAVLRRLLAQPIYFRVRADDPPAKRRLFTAGEPTDCFVMLLEGHAHVTCGQERLVFNCGPFSTFGKSALMLAPHENQTPVQVLRRESFSPAPPRGLTGQWSASQRRLEQPSGVDSDAGSCGGGASGLQLRATGSRASVASGEQAKARLQCVPDYTVELVSDSTYIRVTLAEYQAAVRASQVERESSTLAIADEDSSTDH